MPTSPTLVNAAQIARLAGVTRATVSNWRRRHPDFPAPIGGTESRPTYDLDLVRAWLADRDQLPPESPVAKLRAALPGDPDPYRLWPLLLAAHRTDGGDLKATLELPDNDLPAHLRDLVAARAREVPGAAEATYPPQTLQPVRALLRCVLADGAATAADVLSEAAGTGNGVPATGTYPTPAPLAALMADLLSSPDGGYPAAVLDPACGGGRLLAAAGHAGARILSGQDTRRHQAAQTAVRLGLLSRPVTINVRVGDSLRADAFDGLAADAVLCVPPFGGRDWGHDELAYDPRWSYGLPAKGDPELAWVQHCLAHLAEGGLAVILLPPAVSERPASRRIRAELVRTGTLRAVAALPAGAAIPRHIGLHLWLLRRPRAQEPAAAEVLFIDAAATGPPPGTAATASPPDGGTAHRTICDSWRAYRGTGTTAVPGVARTVAAIELLDEIVDLTPARHVHTAPSAHRPRRHAADARALRDRLHQAAAQLATLNDSAPWPPAGSKARAWRTATVADLLRGGALTLLRPAGGRGAADPLDSDVVAMPGDIILSEVRRHDRRAATVAGDGTAGRPLRRHQCLLRPDAGRFDPWFVAGFLSDEANLHTASTGTSTVRVDPRRLRVPLLPIEEQRRYGQEFRRLHALRAAAEDAARLAEETTRILATGLTSGALLPPEPPTPEGPR